MAPSEKLKQSLYFSEQTLREIMAEAVRLDRSLSWTVQQAWKIARGEVQRFPTIDRGIGEPRPRPRPGRPPLAPAPAARPVEGAEARQPSAQVREFLRGKFDREVTS